MRPQFSVISAVYNVGEYIEEYLASLERQTYGLANLEVILVDDGSTDGSGDTAEVWAKQFGDKVRVLRQENAGQGAARNAGIAVATGEWVTFADPDDVLADTYFAEVAEFLATQATAPDLLASRLLTFSDDITAADNRHALRKNFGRGNEVVDLNRFPNRIHLSAGTAFLPLDRLREAGIGFDPRIRPTFEDGHLIGLLLLRSRSPQVGFIPTAEYYYRKRADGTSSVQSAWTRDDKYVAVPRYGYLDLLRQAAEAHGRAPQWVQNTVLYDLLWYFKADSRLIAATGAVGPEVQAEFHALCREIFAFIDVETILGFVISPTAYWLRRALVAGYKHVAMRPTEVRLDAVDDRQRLVRARYTYSGPRPEEAFFWRGREVDPVHEKVRSVEFFGRGIAHERIVWLPADGTVRIELDGRPTPLTTHAPSDLPFQITAAKLAERFGASGLVRPTTPAAAGGSDPSGRRGGVVSTRLGDWTDRDAWTARVARRLARCSAARAKYADAWVLMDRQDQAQDSAEHLYRYLKRKRPQVNAWFVLDKSSPDWARLEREGFAMVAYGSMQWRVLLLNARHVVSSHANAFVLSPLSTALYGPMPWRFTFLQHGVGKDDYSRWLNDKKIDLLVTTTEAEEKSFSGDETPYVLTTKEVRRTGLPRHDALLAKAHRLTAAEVDRILIMPTWRHSLTAGLPESMPAEERRAAFLISDYAQHWFELLRSPELRDLAQRTGRRLSLLPHPNMTPLLMSCDLPSHVELLRWADVDVQNVFASTALLLTDYSSMAFEVAFLGRPTVYFQFDRKEFFSGAQPYRRGYFEYERDGFGPVVTSHEGVVAAVERLACAGFEPEREVRERIKTTFGERTGDSCYRAFKAISQLDRPVRARLTESSAAALLLEPSVEETLIGDAAVEAAALEEAVAEGLIASEVVVLLGDVDEELPEPEPVEEDELVAVSADGVLPEEA